MKYQIVMAAALVLLFSACKTPYKATDQPRSSSDSTLNNSDTTSLNRLPGATDSVSMHMDSTQMDPTNNPSQTDTLNNQQRADTSTMQATTDTARSTGEPDPTMNQIPDSAKLETGTSPNNTGTAPAAVSDAFTKQYPNAGNAAWSAYDSLAAVPIDLRLTGWTKMDADDHMVKFDLDGDTYYAWYDQDGNWIGSASPMKDFTKLPAAVNDAIQNAIRSRYTDYNVSQVNREFQEGKKTYEVELTSGDNRVRMLVGSDGKISQIYRYNTDKSKKDQ